MSDVSIVTLLAQLADGVALSRDAARSLMDVLLSGQSTPAQTGAVLMALRRNGVDADALAGLVEGMRAASVTITPQRQGVVDLCGTGGDGSGTFNISTAASLVVAASGVPVAKHGNRSASSRCGSADVLEALGIPVDLPPERASASIEAHGFAFLFAPLYHPAMKHVGPVRQELKLRTVFNLLGPLASPAGVKRQLIGVFDGSVRALLAGVLQRLGSERVWLVHGEGGLDELSLSGPTHVTECTPDRIEERTVSAADAGLSAAPLAELAGGDAAENAAIIASVLRGEAGPRRDVVLLNAAAALLIAGVVDDLAAGVARAAEAIDSGAAAQLVETLRTTA